MNRIKEFRRRAGMNQTELASRVGITQGALSGWENGRYEPDLRSLGKIADLFGVSVDELLGRASPVKDLPDGTEPILPTRQIPLLGSIACGAPLLAEENYDGTVPCPEEIDADFCLRCHGDSMIGARIHDGDIVYIKSQPEVENGEIAAVLIDDEATLKRVYRRGGSVILQPENPAYEPLVFTGEDTRTLRILGKAVWFFSRVH